MVIQDQEEPFAPLWPGPWEPTWFPLTWEHRETGVSSVQAAVKNAGVSDQRVSLRGKRPAVMSSCTPPLFGAATFRRCRPVALPGDFAGGG